ncbi:site-specific integrase [Pedobacter insulae]|uniref:Site-specific recombinase XerD n=1 Tax=Pedobacter insulae TaxID=414048 RepID=A0A1I2SZU2_9SPHI|nr:site-specific integrase [Pedobacter insulae]SFG58090.1 Site-specific recombinase XerD [Pedobacter insulae]
MKNNLSVLFYLKKPKNYQSGPMPIYMRITLSGAPKELSIGRACEPKKWNNKVGRVSGRDEASKNLNAYIDTFRIKIEDIHLKLLRSDSELSPEIILNTFLGKKEKPHLLLEIFQEHNDKLEALIGKGFTKGTLTKYNTTMKHLKAFMKLRFRISDIEIKEIEYYFITEFDFYLRSTCSCANNSAIKHLKNLGKILRECIAKKWISHDPFAGHKNKLKKVERVKLSEDELSLLYDKEISNARICQVRDVFLFCCYTGLSFIDVLKLSRSDIQNGMDGKQWIFIKRQKTAVASHVPLLPIAIEIMEKYSEHADCMVNEKVLPVSSNQKMNAYLKEVADLCGIEKLLTFHIARHTFATTVTLGQGVPIESVSKMLGHTDIRTTQIYAKVMDTKVGSDMDKLRKKMHTA